MRTLRGPRSRESIAPASKIEIFAEMHGLRASVGKVGEMPTLPFEATVRERENTGPDAVLSLTDL
jgi:hypothetical protein